MRRVGICFTTMCICLGMAWLVYPDVVFVLRIGLTVGPSLFLWFIYKSLKTEHQEKFSGVTHFIPSRDLKLFFQTGKYTDGKLCPYWGVANFFLGQFVFFACSLFLVHADIALFIVSLVLSYFIHLLIFIWDARIEYWIRCTSDVTEVNAENWQYLALLSPYIMNGAVSMAFMGILLTPLAKQPIDARLVGFSEEEAMEFEARHHRVTDAEVKVKQATLAREALEEKQYREFLEAKRAQARRDFWMAWGYFKAPGPPTSSGMVQSLFRDMGDLHVLLQKHFVKLSGQPPGEPGAVKLFFPKNFIVRNEKEWVALGCTLFEVYQPRIEALERKHFHLFWTQKISDRDEQLYWELKKENDIMINNLIGVFQAEGRAYTKGDVVEHWALIRGKYIKTRA